MKIAAYKLQERYKIIYDGTEYEIIFLFRRDNEISVHGCNPKDTHDWRLLNYAPGDMVEIAPTKP
jgi:hypothetical protein